MSPITAKKPSPDEVEQQGEESIQLLENLQSIKLATGSRQRKKTENGLKEDEVIVLGMLQKNGIMIVGDIQRVLGVLPAQMSRIVRSLENREQAFIQCSINSRDKRKIDVELLEAGQKILHKINERRARRLDCVPLELLQEANSTLAEIIRIIRENTDETL